VNVNSGVEVRLSLIGQKPSLRPLAGARQSDHYYSISGTQ
jgi:hypothetical protein